jgi:hypothetical protein
MRTALTIWLMALALAVAGCAAAACDPSAESSEAADFEEARLAFAECMREHDVDFPDPDSSGEVALGPEQMEDPDFREAQEACDPLLETATGDFQPDVEEEALMQERALAFSQCMRDHGVDFPDPVFQEGGATISDDGHDFDPEDPAFQEVQEVCAEETNFGRDEDEEEGQ